MWHHIGPHWDLTVCKLPHNSLKEGRIIVSRTSQCRVWLWQDRRQLLWCCVYDGAPATGLYLPPHPACQHERAGISSQRDTQPASSYLHAGLILYHDYTLYLLPLHKLSDYRIITNPVIRCGQFVRERRYEMTGSRRGHGRVPPAYTMMQPIWHITAALLTVILAIQNVCAKVSTSDQNQGELLL